MTWRHLLMGLGVLVACSAGVTHGQDMLDPGVVETALTGATYDNGGGTYLDFKYPWSVPYWVRGEFNARTTTTEEGGTGGWYKGPTDDPGPETWAPTIQVDGDYDDLGDGWYHPSNQGDGDEFRMFIQLAQANTIFDVWLVGLARNDLENTGVGDGLDMGLRWTTAKGDYLGSHGDTWYDLRYAPGAVQIAAGSGVYDSYGVKGSAQVMASSAGTFDIYVDDSSYEQDGNWSWVDGVVIKQVDMNTVTPETIETIVGGGTYLDVAPFHLEGPVDGRVEVPTAYTRNGLTGTAQAEWDRTPAEHDPFGAHPEYCLDQVLVDGNLNGRGDAQHAPGGEPSQEIQYDITGLVANGTYELWGVGLDHSEGAAGGFKWGTSSGFYTETWLDLESETGARLIAEQPTVNIWKSWAVPATSTVQADGDGNLTLYFQDTSHGDGSTVSYLDGIVLRIAGDIPGDANHNGHVDADDLAVVAGNWGSGTELEPATWEEGNFNEDWVVDALDAAIVAANWTGPGEAGAVPEPAAIVLLMTLALGGVLLRRGR